MTGFARSVTRITGLIVKELRDLARRPGAIITLVLGPLAVMALFGAGFVGERQPFETIVVLPAGSALPHDLKTYQDLPTAGLRVVDVTEDLASAEARLMRRAVRLVVIVPGDAEQRLRAGEQATLRVEWNEVDPIEDSVARVSTAMLTSEVNRKLIETVAAEGMRFANLPDKAIPPQVIAQPLKAESQNRSPIAPSVLFYFTPAVFALILQHLGITLTALALVRDRMSGVMDLLRVAPVRSWEVLVGKYVAYGLLSILVGAVVGVLMVRVLAIPLLGSPERLATAVALLTFASLGAGLLISLVADSERQAVQLAMLLLLLSVFFSGFVLPVDEFRPIVRPVSYLLPVTYGINLFQDIMLRGGSGDPLMLAGLAAIGVALYAIDALRLRQIMRIVA
ncbi:MAG TPA: ABC transporter permease [Candidatus Limnocylindrales bacterium]|nr:ABC transporter permease [Candidatus Limnocylindrales bacterium]